MLEDPLGHALALTPPFSVREKEVYALVDSALTILSWRCVQLCAVAADCSMRIKEKWGKTRQSAEYF